MGWNEVKWEDEGCSENWRWKATWKKEMEKGILCSVFGVEFIKTV